MQQSQLCSAMNGLHLKKRWSFFYGCMAVLWMCCTSIIRRPVQLNTVTWYMLYTLNGIDLFTSWKAINTFCTKSIIKIRKEDTAAVFTFFWKVMLKWDFYISAVTIYHILKISHPYFHWYFYQNTLVCTH